MDAYWVVLQTGCGVSVVAVFSVVLMGLVLPGLGIPGLSCLDLQPKAIEEGI